MAATLKAFDAFAAEKGVMSGVPTHPDVPVLRRNHRPHLCPGSWPDADCGRGERLAAGSEAPTPWLA